MQINLGIRGGLRIRERDNILSSQFPRNDYVTGPQFTHDAYRIRIQIRRTRRKFFLSTESGCEVILTLINCPLSAASGYEPSCYGCIVFSRIRYHVNSVRVHLTACIRCIRSHFNTVKAYSSAGDRCLSNVIFSGIRSHLFQFNLNTRKRCSLNVIRSNINTVNAYSKAGNRCLFNIIFSGKNMGILKNRITTQADGYSLIDKELKTFIK